MKTYRVRPNGYVAGQRQYEIWVQDRYGEWFRVSEGNMEYIRWHFRQYTSPQDMVVFERPEGEVTTTVEQFLRGGNE